jgi:DNA-binding beta-propeller fold protein YncE
LHGQTGASIGVGRRPTSAVLSLDGREAWVVSAGSNRVDILDRTNPFLHSTITVTHAPDQITLSTDGRLAFVTSQALPVPYGFPQDDCGVLVVQPQGGRVTILDTQSRTVSGVVPIASGRPVLALPARRGDRLFVVTEAGTVEVVNLASRAVVATVSAGAGQVLDAALHPNDGKLFISRFGSGADLVVMDTWTYAIRAISLAPQGYTPFFGGRLTFDPSGALLFANAARLTDFQRFTLVLDAGQEQPAGFVPGGFGGIAFRPDGKRVYLFSPEFLPAPGTEGVVLELPGLSPVRTLPVGGQNAAIARDGSMIYLARYGAAFRHGLTVGSGYQFRYDLTTVDPDTPDHSTTDVNSTFVFCTMARDLVLSGNGRDLLVTNPAIDTVTWFQLPAPAEGSSFHTIAPCRLADSRQPAASTAVPNGGPALAAGSSRTLPVTGHCGIPTTARAISANVTVTDPVTAGHLTIYPTGAAAPTSSVLNFRPGMTRANNATLKLGPSGALTVAPALAAGYVHVLVDVVGYWQ